MKKHIVLDAHGNIKGNTITLPLKETPEHYGLYNGSPVMVVQSLPKNVVSSRTGRVLGKTEKVIGRGTVSIDKSGGIKVISSTPIKVIESEGSGRREFVGRRKKRGVQFIIKPIME